MFNDEDYYDESIDPMDEIEAERIWMEEIENSMKIAYDMIEEFGIKEWNSIVKYDKTKKMRILNNMIHFYEGREEYEKCAFLLSGLNFIKK